MCLCGAWVLALCGSVLTCSRSGMRACGAAGDVLAKGQCKGGERAVGGQ